MDVMVQLGGHPWLATDTLVKNECCTIALPVDATRPPVLPRRQQSLGTVPSMARYRTESTACEPRLSICSTSGTVYESVVVVGHMHGSDNVVYYLLEVRSGEMPLEGYVVRRRYNDFRKFYDELSHFMPLQCPRRSTSIGFGLNYTSLLCNPLIQTIPEAWSPVHPETGRVPDQRRPSWMSPTSGNALMHGELRNPRRSSSAVLIDEFRPHGGVSSYESDAVLPLDTVTFNRAGRPWLPPMPSGGVLTLFTTRHTLIMHRIAQFNHILAAVMSDKSRDVAKLLMTFIQEKPGTLAQTYTNLSEYAPIDIPFSVERYARRRAMSIGKRQPRD